MDMIEKTISHYRVVEKLGVVYTARDTHLGRFVAIEVRHDVFNFTTVDEIG